MSLRGIITSSAKRGSFANMVYVAPRHLLHGSRPSRKKNSKRIDFATRKWSHISRHGRAKEMEKVKKSQKWYYRWVFGFKCTNLIFVVAVFLFQYFSSSAVSHSPNVSDIVPKHSHSLTVNTIRPISVCVIYCAR